MSDPKSRSPKPAKASQKSKAPARKFPAKSGTKNTNRNTGTQRQRGNSSPKPARLKSTTQVNASGWIKLALLAVAVAVVLCLGMMWVALFKPMPLQKTTLLTIREGQTYNGLIRQMADKGWIRFPLVLKVYTRLMSPGSLKAGVYEIPAAQTPAKLIALLGNGKLARLNRVTVIEGANWRQLSAKWKTDNAIEQKWLLQPEAMIAQQLGIKGNSIEGWLSPDTYYFAQGTEDSQILKTLYQAQKKTLDTAWLKRSAGLPYKTPYEALIMASIVEKETGIASERPEVAAVFINRLRLGMRLQTDPTVIYGMGANYQGNITRTDLQTPTPWNTYQINGLPPTPIAMPGKAAIEAALHPANTPALYFVASGTGGHVFSDTLEQHHKAVARYVALGRLKRQQAAAQSTEP